jgi:transcription antitermination factor NusG
MLAPLTSTEMTKLITPIVPASFPRGLAWFVAFVSPLEMQRSKDREGNFFFPVERRINEASFETYVPIEVKKEYKRGKHLRREHPVLGPYVFVRFEPCRARDRSAILNTEGVHSLLGAMDVPQRVPDGLIQALRRAEEAGLFGGEGFKAGDRVEILDDRFSGLIARVKSASKKKRVQLILAELGTIELDAHQVRKI